MWFFFNKKYADRSPQWPKIRKQHLAKYPCCMACGSSIKPEVHHIIPVYKDPTKELDPDNLITLCDKYCHFIFGHLMNWKSYNIDVKKDCIFFNHKIKQRP